MILEESPFEGDGEGLLGDNSSDVLGGTLGAAIGLRALAGLGAAVGLASSLRAPVVRLVSALAVLSFAFDGHTATKGNRALTSLVDVVHVGAAAVWLGGLVCLFVFIRTQPEDVWSKAVLRFSTIAAAALALVGLAGLGLTVTILDSFSGLWTTSWGQLLIAKTAFVAIVAGIGGYNHRTVVPQLSATTPGHARTLMTRTVAIELVGLTAAVALTAALVVAAS